MIDKTNFNFVENKLNNDILEKMLKNKIINDYYFDNNFCLINGECLKVMEFLVNEGVLADHIITDIPYGTIQGLSIEGWKNKNIVPVWDEVIDKSKMLDLCFKITKANSNVLLFSQEPLTHLLLKEVDDFQKFSLSNKMVWVKNNHANGFNAKSTPLNYYEEILLLRKCLDENNSKTLRMYFKNMLEWIGVSKKEIMLELGQGLDHCFRYENRTFAIPTEKNYEKLMQKYNIQKWKNFIEYDSLKKEWDRENKVIFNLLENKIMKNVLVFNKETKNIHPTQKPQDLLKHLIKIFSNENDLLLDFTSGSGSLGIAAIALKRRFVGIELNREFYDKSLEWYLKTKENN